MSLEGQRLPVYILAGGRSSRFGADKARVPLGGKALLQANAECLAPLSSTVTVIARHAGQYHDLGLRTIGDLQRGLGPLGGLATALADMHRPGWLALAACDWVGVRANWWRPLQRAATPDRLCVVYASPRPEPLFALYHTAIAETVHRHLEKGRYAMHDLIQAVPHRMVQPPPGWSRAQNINYRKDLEQFQQQEGLPHA